jgi:hypothetical protein
MAPRLRFEIALAWHFNRNSDGGRHVGACAMVSKMAAREFIGLYPGFHHANDDEAVALAA